MTAMAQRSLRPLVGVLCRPISAGACAAPRNTTRALSSSARRPDEQPSDAASSTPASAAAANPDNRRARSEIALRQITNLRNRRIQPGGLARGNFPSGQVVRQPPTGGAPGAPDGGDMRAASPRMAKLSARPTTTHGSTPPEGRQMVRAPNTLRISRNATVGSMRGPNLGARTGARTGGKGKSAGREQAPMRRDKKANKIAQGDESREIDFSRTLSDGMVRNLLRLQRKEWDRVPYEPKYAPGSFAANELIHEGRELMRGEVPPVKIWGRLEKRIGVVGMFGAEAHLKVRRVPDGDAAPFGHEEDATT